MCLILACGGFLGIAAMHLIYPFIHCHACPLATAACPVGTLQRFVTLGEIPWYLLGALTIYGFALGRAFCGWACPFGLLQDVIDKVRKKKIRPSVAIHRKAILLKFVILGAILFLAWKTADVMYCKICPPATIEAALPYQLQHGVTMTPLFAGRIALFIGLIAAMVLVTRFWCRYLCPFGACLAAFNRASFVQINVDLKKCNECGACEVACPMGVEVRKAKGSIECIKCGRCIDVCKRGAIRFGLLRVSSTSTHRRVGVKTRTFWKTG